MPRAPYLLIGFDVDPANPNGPSIVADVERDFPYGPVTSVGVENMYILEVPPSLMIDRFRRVTTYLTGKDAVHQNAVRWVVQLCRSSEVSVG
ncbi:MAG: hypothetical protein WD801_12350 [Gemmatimonadaceae bacterium]